MKVIIVGGVAGGMSAATRLRRLDANAEIIVLEKSGHVSYANCGLPYYVGGVIEDEESLFLQTPESLHARFRLDVRVLTEAVEIDVANRRVKTKYIPSGEFADITYDKLILSPGASAVVPPLAGVELALTLRTVEDVEKIVSRVDRRPRHAVVIGGGFIGVEIAENLINKGISTALVEATPQVLAPLDPEMATFVADELVRHGVQVFLGESVELITTDSVRLSSGEVIPSDLVILAIGVRPDIALAKAAGLTIGDRGGIEVNEYNLTSDASIYAVGDAAEKRDSLDGSATLVPLANIANRHGRVVADHITGREVRNVPTIGTAIVKVFDLMVATTGWNEKRLLQRSRAFQAIHTHPGSHAGYYPGSNSMALKLLLDPISGEILGAQGIGITGIDKRIDVIATAIRGGLTGPQLADLELAYAPPFGSAKDPVNMLGYIAENLLSHLVTTVQWSETEDLRRRGYSLVDVRTESEFSRGALPGAINIPVDELRERLMDIPTNEVLIYCQVGQRGHTAALLLNEMGFNARNLDGGYQTWSHSPAMDAAQLPK
jgi:NADPH-dependent 2,4-dienoyl-CoA reductase/sulfur reductase-like enzyme/rhodanese-related sulfurtransferase